MAVTLDLLGDQSLAPRDNINVSNLPSEDQWEMMIDVNPSNPLNLAAISHRSDATSRRYIDVFHTMDGGQTWQITTIGDETAEFDDGLGDSTTVDGFRFDPVIAFDANGVLYVAYGYQEQLDTTLVVGRSTDFGNSFAFTHVDQMHGIAPNNRLDKMQIATGLDPTSGNQAIYVAYLQVEFASSESIFRVVVSRSNDGGVNFTDPRDTKYIVNDTAIGNHTVFVGAQFPDPAVGPNGELYVSWHNYRDDVDIARDNTILFDVDPDGLWGPDDFGDDVLIAELQTEFDTFNAQIPAQPTRGIRNAVALDVDLSSGRLYTVWVDADASFHEVTNPDSNVFLAYSANNGATWTPTGINGELEGLDTSDFNPWVDVDQTTGSVNVIYYQSAERDGGTDADVHVALRTSPDGEMFGQRTILSTATSNAGVRDAPIAHDYGEYIGLVAHDGTLHGLWSDTRDNPTGDLEAYTASASFRSSSINNLLTITGDDNGTTNDTIIVRRSSQNPDFLEVLVNSNLQFAGLVDSINQIAIDGRGGNDLIEVHSNIAADMLIDGGTGADELKLIGTSSSELLFFQFNGGSGDDVFTVDFRNGDPLPRPGFNFSFNGGDGNDNVAVLETTGAPSRTGYFVNSFTDNNPASQEETTLREAVDAANQSGSRSYIFLPPGRNLLANSLGSLNITGNVVIIGSGAGLSLIDGGGATGINKSVVRAMSNSTLELSRVTLTGGNAVVGGGVDISGGGLRTMSNSTATVTDSAIVGNNADYEGGGIHNYGSLTVRRSVITNNSAMRGGGLGHDGGIASFEESIIANNSAVNTIFGTPSDPDVEPSSSFVTSLGDNLLTSGPSSIFNQSGDLIEGGVHFVVASVTDDFSDANRNNTAQSSLADLTTVSVREAIDKSNEIAGQQKIWVPAWRFTLTQMRGTQPTDIQADYGDLDITQSLILRGIASATRFEWRQGIVDRVFELLGDYDNDGTVDDDDDALLTLTNGSTTDLRADGDDDGLVEKSPNDDDYDIWAAHDGNTLTTNIV